ncbi:MAG: UDP-N-acetylglucosamine 2-epimerase (non-hydrolyzing) [Marinilabiliaceae bacterium]|nr:UDP-N-acetylglucosamine 2-epimerase (non-hydrolyzing) [Marinilabiliaceae bacterium]
MRKNTILIIFGTRPEAIKFAPIILEAQNHTGLKCLVCNTAQHRDMTDEVLNFFDIKADYDLNLMTPGQSLFDITARGIKKLESVLDDCQPDLILVQGDTTTAFLGALAGYYKKIKVGHVEAGLRSGDNYAPHPEELNRKMIGSIAHLHFTPTDTATRNLQREGTNGLILKTGNTVIDALLFAHKKVQQLSTGDLPFSINPSKRTILVTTHRRENFGQPLLNILTVIKTISTEYPDVDFIFPVHPNPQVKDIVSKELTYYKNIQLIAPLSYPHLIYLMSKSYLILSDSGGIQEEAPTLGKPIVVLRDVTERQEGIDAGTAILGSTNFENIYSKTKELLDNQVLYHQMSRAQNPYGDGTSSSQIIEIIKQQLS